MRCSRHRSSGRDTSLGIKGKGRFLAIPRQSILLLRESGLEFASPKPYALFSEFDLDLEGVGAQRVRAAAVVVGCHQLGVGQWRISLLFSGAPKDRENLSLAA